MMFSDVALLEMREIRYRESKALALDNYSTKDLMLNATKSHRKTSLSP